MLVDLFELSRLPQSGQRDGPSKCAIGYFLHILLDSLYLKSLVEARSVSRQRKARVMVVCAMSDADARDGCLGKWMAEDVLGRIMACDREMDKNRTPYKPRCRLPADQRHSVLAYAGRLSRIGSGDGDVVDIKCFVVCQMSLANQKKGGLLAKQAIARVPLLRMQASVNASNGRTVSSYRAQR
jgi:hypothetical protein